MLPKELSDFLAAVDAQVQAELDADEAQEIGKQSQLCTEALEHFKNRVPEVFHPYLKAEIDPNDSDVAYGVLSIPGRLPIVYDQQKDQFFVRVPGFYAGKERVSLEWAASLPEAIFEAGMVAERQAEFEEKKRAFEARQHQKETTGFNRYLQNAIDSTLDDNHLESIAWGLIAIAKHLAESRE